MLFEPNFAFLQELVEQTPTTDVDQLAKDIIFIAESRGESIKLLEFFIRTEITASQSESTLFSNNIF